MWYYLFAKKAESVEHLLVPRRADGTQQDDLLDAEGSKIAAL